MLSHVFLLCRALNTTNIIDSLVIIEKSKQLNKNTVKTLLALGAKINDENPQDIIHNPCTPLGLRDANEMNLCECFKIGPD